MTNESVHKEIKVILNILKSFNNIIPNELIPNIFENLKTKYSTPEYRCPLLYITSWRTIYEIEGQFYEFAFCYGILQSETTTIKFIKIKKKKDVIEEINSLINYYQDLNNEQAIKDLKKVEQSIKF